MAVIFTGNDFNGISLATNGDTYITREDEYVTNVVLAAFDFNDTDFNTYLVEGTVVSDDGPGIISFIGSQSNDVVVAASGLVMGGTTGISMSGADHQVINNGKIIGRDDNGVALDETSTLSNFGEIVGGFVGVSAFGNGNRIWNHGQIAATTSIGVSISGSGNRLVNTGEIVSHSDDGVRLGGDDNSFVNDGRVIADDEAVELAGAAGEQLSLSNSGLLSGRDANGNAVVGSAADERVVNSGLIDGGLNLGGGPDRVVNWGEIIGDVVLGAGNDRYTAQGSGSVAGTVDGGPGADTLTGSDAPDSSLHGGAGNDRLNGRGGDDVQSGGGGNDWMRGGNGDDQLFGGSGKDTLVGNSGDDRLIGNAGDDELIGGSGDDILDGGRGSDRLSGGSDQDTFVYAPNDDIDRVLDFENDIDLIDLTAFGFNNVGQALAFAADVGRNVVFDFGGGDRLIVKNTTVDQLADDILV